jgi:hypothetical protein
LVEIIKPTFSLSLRCQNTIIDLNDNVVGIHVRRGDFLTNKSFGACTIDYYLAAIREIRNSVKDPVFLVFTNNASWVRQNFPKDISYQIYSDDNKNSDIEEMFLMSKMKSLIICNSTFSWWSAYLNSPDSLIICPHRWHISEKLETKIPGLISPAWRTIGNTLELSQ